MTQAIIHSSMTLILLAKIIPQVCLRILTDVTHELINSSGSLGLPQGLISLFSLVWFDSLSLCITLCWLCSIFSHHYRFCWLLTYLTPMQLCLGSITPILGTVHKLAENLHDFPYMDTVALFSRSGFSSQTPYPEKSFRCHVWVIFCDIFEVQYTSDLVYSFH